MCDVCKKKSERLYSSRLHFFNCEPLVIQLCYIHDIELFKKGQERFMKDYANELSSKLRGKTEVKDIDPLDLVS